MRVRAHLKISSIFLFRFGSEKEMPRLRVYIITRLLLLLPVLLGVIFLVFVITMVFDPVARVSLYVTNVQQLTDRNILAIIEKYGLNDPAHVQFGRWFSQLLQGNLGISRVGHQPVAEAIVTRFPVTAELVLISAPLIIIIGIYLGVESAVHKDKMIDHITRTAATIGMSLPSFWFSIILIFIFYASLGWFPTGRLSIDAHTFTQTNPSFTQYTRMYTVDGILNGQLWITFDAIRHIVLPVVVLTTMQIALIVRIMRSSMLEALNKGYIVAARAKGLPEKEVINKHARRNALIPATTLSGMMVAAMLSGVVITEVVFGINGLGFWAAQAVLNLDVASIVGFTMFSGTIIVLANLIVDILYAYLDPRIRID